MTRSVYGTITPVYEKCNNGEIKQYGFKGRKGLGRNPMTGKYNQKTFYAKTVEGVKKQMLAYLSMPIDKLEQVQGGLNVETWTSYWLENIKLPMVKKSSEKSFRNMVNIINKDLGWRNIKTVTRLMLQMVINARATEGKNTSFLKSVISQCFKDAYDCGYIDNNITKGLRYKDKPAAIKIPLSNEDDEKIAKYISGKKYENAIIFLRGSACRVSEMCGLTWDKVNEENGYVMIAQQQGDDEDDFGIKVRGIIHTTKNNLFAPAYVPKYVFKALAHEKERQEEYARKNGRFYKNPLGYVFTNEYGEPFTPKQLNAFIKKLGKEIGRSELTAHYFRHTRASEVYQKTKDPLVVQKLLRHKDLSVTLRYLHLIMGCGEEVEKILQEDHDRLMEKLYLSVSSRPGSHTKIGVD